jgi:hypothetical protein
VLAQRTAAMGSSSAIRTCNGRVRGCRLICGRAALRGSGRCCRVLACISGHWMQSSESKQRLDAQRVATCEPAGVSALSLLFRDGSARVGLAEWWPLGLVIEIPQGAAPRPPVSGCLSS